MAHNAVDIQQERADTQQDMNDTWAAMTEKFELLGEHVQETVEGAQASVEEMVDTVRDTVDTTVATVKQTVEGAQASMEEMVENVRDTVGETVDAVQRTFDLHYQMEQHPWLLLSGSLVVGYLLGSRGSSSTAADVSTSDPRSSPASLTSVSPSESPARPQPQQRGNRTPGRFTNEIAAIKSAAVGAMVSTLCAMVKQALLPLPTLPLTSTGTKQDS